jgi:alkylation response protein AidB-like acyl-CoA dehydrogenase
MRWELSEEQELFTTSLREWLGQRAEPAAVRDWLDAGDLSSFERLFAGEGWAGVGFDEKLGGQGGGLLELALTARELGRAAAPSATWLQSAIVVPALADEPALVRAANESGELTAFAVRADRIPAGSSSVESRGDRLHGRIPCVLGATRAARFVVPVADGESVSLWLVDAADGGVGLHPRSLLDRSRDAADVTLDDVPARRLGADATAAIGEIATRAAVLTSADALGASERMLQLAVDYSKQRQQFGQPIGAFQAVKHRLADMEKSWELGYAALRDAARAGGEDPGRFGVAASVARVLLSDAYAEASVDAVHLHGGIGFTWEHDAHLYYKNGLSNKVLFGAPGEQLDRLAASLGI